MGINWSNTWVMGRVSKHKKIKACDPFYKGPRRDTSIARGDNLPPGGLEDDQPVPKSLLRLMRAGQRTLGHRNESTFKMKSSHQSKGKPAKELHQSVPEGEGVSVGKEKEELALKRRKGESLKEFLDRIDVEGRARMVESYKANRQVTERRKKYYEKRRQRLESRKGSKIEEGAVEFADLKDDVMFGEVASAPPRLIAKPRGSQKTRTKSKTKAHSQDAELNPETKKPMTKDANPATVSVVGLKRKQDIEEERERLIQEYRMSKKAKLSRTKSKNRQLIL